MMHKFLNKKQKEHLEDDGWSLFDSESGGVYFTIDGEQIRRGKSLGEMSKLDPESTYKFLVFAYKKNEVIH